MKELVAQVKHWHEATFTGRSPLKTAKKVLEEASELHIAIKADVTLDRGPGLWHARKFLRDEMADVVICVMALASFYDMDLQDAVEKKLVELQCRVNQQERDTERGID